MKSTTKYQEVPIDVVMNYFAKGFEMVNDEKLIRVDYFIDTMKMVVLFRIDVDQP